MPLFCTVGNFLVKEEFSLLYNSKINVIAISHNNAFTYSWALKVRVHVNQLLFFRYSMYTILIKFEMTYGISDVHGALTFSQLQCPTQLSKGKYNDVRLTIKWVLSVAFVHTGPVARRWSAMSVIFHRSFMWHYSVKIITWLSCKSNVICFSRWAVSLTKTGRLTVWIILKNMLTLSTEIQRCNCSPFGVKL